MFIAQLIIDGEGKANIEDIIQDPNHIYVKSQFTIDGDTWSAEWYEKPKKTRKQFVPPTPEEAMTYFLSKGSDSGAVFYNHYESQGWQVGRNKMVNWQRAADNWLARDKKQQQRNGKGLTSSAAASFING